MLRHSRAAWAAAGRGVSRLVNRRFHRLQLEALESRHLLTTTVVAVDTFADVVDPLDGLTSLREAVIAANSSSDDYEIQLSAGTYLLSIVSGSGPAGAGDLDILDNGGVKIIGAGADATTIDASGLFDPISTEGDSIFIVQSDATLAVESVTLSGGFASLANRAGAIHSLGGNVTVSNSKLTGNVGLWGGAIFNGGGHLLIESSTISNNVGLSGSGIYATEGSETTILRSTIADNTEHPDYPGFHATASGGIENRGTMTILQSTISGNLADTGGGITNLGDLTILHSTVTGNVGGGLVTFSDSTTTLEHTIVAGNTHSLTFDTPADITPFFAPDASNGPVVTGSYNLIGDPATAGGLVHGVDGNIVGDGAGNLLDINSILDTTLADNGGPTLTHALVLGSPAINAGDPAFDPNTYDPPLYYDQRGPGYDRVTGGRVDVGAFEYGSLLHSAVVGRYLFYDGSFFDGNLPGPNALDDAAIAPDKQPLFGNLAQAGPNNVTNYSRGITGLMIDISGSHPNLWQGDFIFRMGTSDDPASWTLAPDPSAIDVRPGAGENGSDRVVITWPEGAIRNTYLQVIVAANLNTGLTNSDVFFFGNKPGDTFETLFPVFLTNTADEIAARGHFQGGVSITNPYDFDRNGIAGAAADQIVTRTYYGPMARMAALVTPVNLSAQLANDTAPGGTTNADGLTSDSTVTGSVAAGAEVTSLTGTLLGGPLSFDLLPYLQPDGTFTFNPLALFDGLPSPGSWVVHVEAVDADGISAALDVAFSYDPSIATPTVDLIAADDSGASNSDNFTNVVSPRIDVNAEAGAAVRLYLDGQLAAEGTAAPGLQFTLGPLDDGTHEVYVVAEDLAGNSATSSVLPFHIWTEAPVVSLATLTTISSDRTPHVNVSASGLIGPGAAPSPVIIDVDLNFDGDFDDPGERDYTTDELYQGGSFFQLDAPLPADVLGSAYFVQLRARVLDNVGNEGASDPVVLKIDTLGAPNLEDYVTSTDTPDYTLVRTIETSLYTYYVLDLRDPTWRSTADVNKPDWQHWLQLVVPHGELTSTALLVVDGGSNSPTAPNGIPGDIATAADLLAPSLHSVLVYLPTVPNEPLQFTGDPGHNRSEDAILAYTFDQYMNNLSDPDAASWPALLPMVQSAVSAMDATQHFVPTVTEGHEVDDFFVTGYSKRGWTTWLTAAADDRVRAIMPGVIDLLNLGEQMVHHYGVYGDFSAWIDDYLAYDIPQESYTYEGQELGRVVDPYIYLNNGRFDDMPKLLMSSTGDEYFLPDASEYFFSDIPGDQNYMRAIPNTGHGLDLIEVVGSTLSFFDAVVNDKPLPEFSWNVEQDGTIVVNTVTMPQSVRLWKATNPTSRDFRHQVHPEIVWTPTDLSPVSPNVYEGNVMVPDAGATAYFIELIFPSTAPFETAFAFTTQIKVATKIPLVPWPYFMPEFAPPPAPLVAENVPRAESLVAAPEAAPAVAAARVEASVHSNDALAAVPVALAAPKQLVETFVAPPPKAAVPSAERAATAASVDEVLSRDWSWADDTFDDTFHDTDDDDREGSQAATAADNALALALLDDSV